MNYTTNRVESFLGESERYGLEISSRKIQDAILTEAELCDSYKVVGEMVEIKKGEHNIIIIKGQENISRVIFLTPDSMHWFWCTKNKLAGLGLALRRNSDKRLN